MVVLIFDFDSEKDEFISSFASVFINGKFFIIDGLADGGFPNTIARLDATTWLWSRAGRLNNARYAHKAIWVNSKLAVVGGAGTRPTEYCDLVNDEFICTDQKSVFVQYEYYPLLFAVTDDYCSQMNNHNDTMTKLY